MILPTKYLKEEDTLLCALAVIFENLESKQSLSELWDKIHNDESIYNYERFILALDLLYMLNIIDFNQNDGIWRIKNDL